VTVLAVLGVVTGAAVAEQEQRPDLVALEPSELRIESDGGEKLLRFTTLSWNSGAAAFELFAKTSLPLDQLQNGQRVEAWQRIYLDGGEAAEYRLPGVDFEWHAGGGHDHFHLSDYADYRLDSLATNGPDPRFGSKTSFCILDTDRVNHRLPNAPKRRVYTECGTAIQGMSVGWGDSYRYYLGGQSINITGLPDGRYTLTIEIDPQHRFLEADAGNTSEEDPNNSASIEIDIQGDSVSVVSQANGGGGDLPGYCRRHPERDGCP
jgi:hypothetical protein